MKAKKALVDTPVIIGGLVGILVIGLFITILVGVNSKINTSMQSSLGTSTAARDIIGNSSATVNSSYSLAANLPLIIVAVLMITVLLGVGYSIM